MNPQHLARRLRTEWKPRRSRTMDRDRLALLCRAAARSPTTSRLTPLYHAIGEIEAPSASVDAEPPRRRSRSRSVATIPNS